MNKFPPFFDAATCFLARHLRALIKYMLGTMTLGIKMYFVYTRVKEELRFKKKKKKVKK